MNHHQECLENCHHVWEVYELATNKSLLACKTDTRYHCQDDYVNMEVAMRNKFVHVQVKVCRRSAAHMHTLLMCDIS